MKVSDIAHINISSVFVLAEEGQWATHDIKNHEDVQKTLKIIKI